MKKNIEEKIDFIMNKRYKISFTCILILAIIGFFLNNITFKEWIFTTDKVLSLWWGIKLFSLLLASYELFYIITDKKRNLSIAGTIVLAFSGGVQWNFTKIDSLILGEIITVLIYKIINEENLKKQIGISIGIIFSVIGFSYTFVGYAIPFLYVFLALIIWIIIANKSKAKKNIKLLITSLFLSLIGAIVSHKILYSYYNDNFHIPYKGFSTLYSYLYNILLPYKKIENAELFAGIISIFPVPMLLSLYYLYTREKHAEFLMPITVVAVIETVFCISGFPSMINKLLGFSETFALRAVNGVSIANLFILFYFLGNIDEVFFKIVTAMRITTVYIIILVLIKYPSVYSTKGWLTVFACELALLTFLSIYDQDKKYKKVLVWFLVILTLIGGIPVLFMG